MDHGTSPTAPHAESTCFFTLIGTPQQEQNAHLLIESLRAFGGRLSGCPVWVLYPSDFNPDQEAWQSQASVQLFSLDIQFNDGYWFAAKVHACAWAEERAGPAIRSLVWLAPENLIVQPPLLFDLSLSEDIPEDKSYAAALRTVHHSNVGSLARQPLDAFWTAVYRSVGLDEAPYTTRSFIDGCELRPYWNTHCFAVDPTLGLLRAWQEGFLAMVADRDFQAGPCRDVPHQVFLHQAVLCALLTKELTRAQIRALPAEYSYPLHMHEQVPPALRAAALNDQVCAVYEDVLPLKNIAVHEPLRSWLAERRAGA